VTDEQPTSRERIDALASVFQAECAHLTRGASRFVESHVDDPAAELAKVFQVTAQGRGYGAQFQPEPDDAEIGRRVRELVVEPAWRRAAMARMR
jgi:hypothetical protein